MIRLEICRLWDGTPIAPGESACIEIEQVGEELCVVIEAPFHDDPAPRAEPGPTDRLWEHEVVELFLLALPEHYLEIELGPHGHHLVLELRGVRRIVRSHLPIDYQASVAGSRWTGEARIQLALVPPGVSRANGYAIHGVGSSRRHLACFPVPGAAPDFHRLACFGPFAFRSAPDP